MREYFPWARGLSEEAFERALLLVGLLSPSLARRRTLPVANELSSLLVARWQGLRGRPWAWRLREGTARLIRGQGEALRLVEAAQELLAESGEDWKEFRPGLRVEVNVPDALEPRALSEALRRAGAHSAYVRRKVEGEMSWSWPLRIGLRTSELLAGVRPVRSLRPLFHEFHYERAPMRANLLLFEESLPEVAEMIVRSRRRPLTDAVVVFGGIGDADTPAWQMLSLLSEATGAQGVFVLDALDPGGAQYAVRRLITLLSHDLPLDSTVARVATELGVPVLAWATRSLVEATSLREQGHILARRLQQMGGARIRLDASTVADLTRSGLAPDAGVKGALTFGHPRGEASATWVRAGDLGATLEERLQPPREAEAVAKGALAGPEPLVFDRESQGAGALARLKEAVATEADAEARRREARYLQARVETGAGRAVRGEAPLRRSREYAACVFIGARDRTWLGLDQPFEASQPPDGSPLLLDVLFWEPTVSPTPQIARLELRPQGNTKVVRFPFRTAADQSVFSARIAVYHRNRNLQTGLLRGRVGDEPAALTFTLDAAPLPKFVGLADRGGVGASIIVNDDPSGGVQAFIYHDGEAAVTDISDVEPAPSVDVNVDGAGGLEGLTTVLGRAINRITSNPDEYSDLSKEGSRTLLLDLALHGNALLTRLRLHSQMGTHFDRVDRIQIVMAHVGAFFPIEYLYDGEAPEDGACICGGDAQAASDALASGTCCGAYAADPTHTICPLRFWSLSKVIERHAHLPEHVRISGQFQLRSVGSSARDRVLDPLRGAVLAASEIADTAVPDTVETLRADLDAALRSHPVPLAGDWASWAQEIARARPTLLVLLPHHLQEGGFDQLEIGGDKRKSMQIRQEHVRGDPDDRPIVLLIGCQTNAAKVNLEGFVPTFQDAGAVIIVSTIASILGRQAGPAAAAIVQELKRQEGNPDATFGDVMLAVRRRLLAAGTPMVLGLTSYGDADWRIGAADGNDR